MPKRYVSSSRHSFPESVANRFHRLFHVFDFEDQISFRDVSLLIFQSFESIHAILEVNCCKVSFIHFQIELILHSRTELL